MSEIERFNELWTPEPYSGCWLWTKYCNACGYGWMARKGKYWMAHRYAWTLYKGEIPQGINVCHKCDTPACVNPDHLFLGTQVENVKDSVSKRRTCRGVKNDHAKLTEEEVKEILASKESGNSLAARFGVNHRTISCIRTKVSWRYLHYV